MNRQRVVRAGAFETNSSSTHSISIAGSCKTPDAFPIIGDECQVHTGEFGWEEKLYHSPTIKAAYCLTFVKSREGVAQERLAFRLKKVLKKETGKKVRFVPTSEEHYEWGYIDHQSEDVCGPAFASDKALRNFIFNPKSWLRTDNDNH